MRKKYNINYFPIARKDLIDIMGYIQEDNPYVAVKFLDQIEDTVYKLEDFPYLEVTPQETHLQSIGYHILEIKNYLFFYLVKENTLEVQIRRIIREKSKYDFLL
ncbi:MULTISPECIES: type II toxin-antitoxin system RelE/ParE family toxin [Petrotogaceae]|jgi:plasmid stabilization system protein ParE|uniref:type II toxin-antitoxin system RelE/ParE family toxin n=1 Tax=Petrotogaceae TaxID=1643949 RepID=UPI000EF286CA|nr:MULTISPECIES: type II toxin-antitoxin system RelE/ParE family toxin [Petrotogaceae]MDN5343827.1 toxin ParE1/3/4 [Oceanotoga sp.]RLL85273.1 translation repressor RelE [Petrotoga sp. Shatin.DS.tank11.9.2.9.3]